jgi:hypothetical protein
MKTQNKCLQSAEQLAERNSDDIELFIGIEVAKLLNLKFKKDLSGECRNKEINQYLKPKKK